LTREVLRLKGEISRKTQWDVKPDLFMFREEEESKQKKTEGKEDEVDKTVASDLVEGVDSGDLNQDDSMFAATENTEFFQQ
jgi:hypothetical protein